MNPSTTATGPIAASMPTSARVGGDQEISQLSDQFQRGGPDTDTERATSSRRSARVVVDSDKNTSHSSSRVPVLQSLPTRHSHSDSHQHDHSETTAVLPIHEYHRKTPQLPALHVPVSRSLNSASVFETANSLGRGHRNTAVAPSRAGNGRPDTKVPQVVEAVDPPTLTSLNSTNESEDLGRIRKILQSTNPATIPTSKNRFPDDDDISPTERLEKFTERNFVSQVSRDQKKLEVAQRSRFGSIPTSSLGYPEDDMIRRRTATGEEVVGMDNYDDHDTTTPSSPFGPDSPVYSPDRPTSAASMRSDILYQRGSTGLRDFERSPRSRRNSNATLEEGKGGVKDKARRRLSAMFNRKASSSKEKFGEDGEFSGRAVGSPSPDLKEKPSIRQFLSRSSSNKSKDGVPFQTVQKRTDERSARTNKESRDNVKEVRPSSAASQRGFANRPPSRQSRLPTASPSTSRPTSSNDHRRTFSTVSSHSERRPLIRSPSSVSLKSRTSDPSSPSASVYQSEIGRPREALRSRRESNPNAGSISSIPKPISLKEARAGSPEKAPLAILKRAESAPAQYTDNPTGIPIGSLSFKPEVLPEVPEKEIVKTKIDPEIEEKVSPTPLKANRNRGNSVDSFLGRRPQYPTNVPPTPPEDIMDTPASLDKGRAQILRSPTLSDYDDLLDDSKVNSSTPGQNSSPLAYRSTRPKPPRTALEDDDSDTELDSLMRSEKDYQSLLNPARNEDDDTFMLLGGSKQYEPSPVSVRSRQDAIAGDRNKERERAANDKLMNRLKTLHLELRSARRGIDYIERKLNGAGSSDESEWIDDDESDGVAKRIRNEESKQRRRAESMQTTEIPAMKPQAGFSPTTRWLILFAQLAMIWFLLEIAMFYRNFPPSASPVPIEYATIPTFGTWLTDTLSDMISWVFDAFLWIPNALVWTVSNLWGLLSYVFMSLGGVAAQAWQTTKTSSSAVLSFDGQSAPSVMPLGDDQVLG